MEFGKRHSGVPLRSTLLLAAKHEIQVRGMGLSSARAWMGQEDHIA